VAALLSGPGVNVQSNIREMARSMTCSADVAYNQTLLLLQVIAVLTIYRRCFTLRLKRHQSFISFSFIFFILLQQSAITRNNNSH